MCHGPAITGVSARTDRRSVHFPSLPRTMARLSLEVGVVAGSIRKRGKQSWELRVYAGRDPETGRKHYPSRTVWGDRADAEAALLRMVEELKDGQHAVRAGTVGELCERWYRRVEADLSPSVAAE